MNILPQKTFFAQLLYKFEHAFEQLFRMKNLFLLMIALQLLWLTAIGWTGTNTNWNKLSFLLLYSLLAGVVVLFLPATAISRLREFKEWLLQKEIRFFLLLCLLVLTIGVFYAHNQRVWGDEEKSFAVAEMAATEGAAGIVKSYQVSGWLRRSHPPLVPILYGLALNLLGVNLFFARLVSILFLLATLWITYLLGRELYDQNTGFVAALLLLSFPLVMRSGASAMMESLLTFCFSLTLLLFLRLLRKPSYRLSVALGIVLGLGLLTKYIMALIFGVLISYALFDPSVRKLKSYLIVATLVSMGLLAVWLFFAAQMGVLSLQIEKIINYSGITYVLADLRTKLQSGTMVSQPAGIESSVDPMKIGIARLGLETLFTRMPSALGVQHIPVILLGGLILLRRRGLRDLFILLWVVALFLILFLTLPDHRYFLPAFPAIAIMIARFFDRFPKHAERGVLLSLLLWGGALYLYVDWTREAHLFLLNP